MSACFAIIGSSASTINGLVDITLFSLIPSRNKFILSIFSFQFVVSLTVSHTKTSKLYFYKCAHFLLSLSLWHSPLFPAFQPWFLAFSPLFPAFPTWFPVFPAHSTHSQHPPHSHPDSLHSHPDSPHSHPDSLHSYDSPHSILRFPIPAFFTDSQITAYTKQSLFLICTREACFGLNQSSYWKVFLEIGVPN